MSSITKKDIDTAFEADRERRQQEIKEGIKTSRKKKKKKNKRIYEDFTATCACDEKHFGTIYYSMITSKQWQALSAPVKNMYLICRVHSQCDIGKNLLMYYVEDVLGRNKYKYTKEYFVLPASHMALYGIDRSNASKYLSELEKRGFLDIERRGHVADMDKKMNIYHFSDRWKYMNIPAADQANSSENTEKGKKK